MKKGLVICLSLLVAWAMLLVSPLGTWLSQNRLPVTDQVVATESSKKEMTSPKTSWHNVINHLTISDWQGNPLDYAVGQWDTFRINGTFELPNNQVMEGDTTLLKLPDSLTFGSIEAFNLMDQTGAIVAQAVIDPENKTILFTYTDYAEKNSDITGNFFFYVKVDSEVVKEKTKLPIEVDIEGNLIVVGEIDYDGLGEKIPTDFDKSGWMDDINPQEGWYYLTINRSNQAFNEVVITDRLQTAGIMIDEESLIIGKGQWFWDEDIGDWVLRNEQNVTSDYMITFQDDKRGFSVDLGDIQENEGFVIMYKITIPYEPIDGERFTNQALMQANKEEIREVESNIYYQKGGGEAEGYHFFIKIRKTNELGQPLATAKFDVIRQRTNQTIGTLVTDESGQASLGNLLRDDYYIIETQAPEGYQLSSEKIYIKAEDFGEERTFYKEIVNQTQVLEPTMVSLQVDKQLIGKELEKEDFFFELKDDYKQVLQVQANDKHGLVQFEPLIYHAPGSYQYTVNEVIGEDGAIRYDHQVIRIEVEVALVNQKLETSVRYLTEPVFVNYYQETTTETEESSSTTETTTTTSLAQSESKTTETTKTTSSSEENSSPEVTTTTTEGLPITGESSNVWLIIIGIGALVLSVYYLASNRK